MDMQVAGNLHISTQNSRSSFPFHDPRLRIYMQPPCFLLSLDSDRKACLLAGLLACMSLAAGAEGEINHGAAAVIEEHRERGGGEGNEKNGVYLRTCVRYLLGGGRRMIGQNTNSPHAPKYICTV